MTLNKRPTEPPQHRADLAGSLAARVKPWRYAEIGYGFLLGVLMWVVDAAMHTQLNESISLGFLDELLRPGLTPALFRGAYVAISVGIGWVLWRTNLKREAIERQERERALASERLRTMLAIVNTFRCEMNRPLAFIAENAQMLASQPRSASDHERLDEIFQSAIGISSFIKHLANSAPMYLVDANGFERIVPHESFENPDTTATS